MTYYICYLLNTLKKIVRILKIIFHNRHTMTTPHFIILTLFFQLIVFSTLFSISLFEGKIIKRAKQLTMFIRCWREEEESTTWNQQRYFALSKYIITVVCLIQGLTQYIHKYTVNFSFLNIPTVAEITNIWNIIPY